MWLVHHADWQQRCTYQDSDGQYKTYLERAAPNKPFGIGCTLCASYAAAHPNEMLGKRTPFTDFTKGAVGRVQLEDLSETWEQKQELLPMQAA